jgi:hypothetical protein
MDIYNLLVQINEKLNLLLKAHGIEASEVQAKASYSAENESIFESYKG